MLFCLDKQQGDKKPCVTLERVHRKATYNNPSFPQLVPSDHPPPLAHGTPHKFAPLLCGHTDDWWARSLSGSLGLRGPMG